MNYLFYLGIIIPTVITIVLFLVFIYCWFLQKARKEVLTKRYDPHGKMRRLGIPNEPPSPPPYCRVGGSAGDLFSDSSGEDNEAYDVSRSPSTEQNVRGRPMYRTYHDSGISAGLSLSPTLEGVGEPTLMQTRSGGMAYRSCPDSGISGFGVQTMQTSACVHHHTCRGCCQDSGSPTSADGGVENIQMQQLNQQQHLQQQQIHQQQLQVQLHPNPNPQQLQLQQQQQQYHQQQLQQQQVQLQQHYPSSSSSIPQSSLSSSSSSSSYNPQQDHHHQQQQPIAPHHVILHHNTIQASVHPSHGVCYGDDMTHPQSPQHYNPPPFHPHAQAIEMGTNCDGGGSSTRQQQQHPYPSAPVANNVNILPDIQEHQQQSVTSCSLQQRTSNISYNQHPSPEHLNSVTQQEQLLQQQQQLQLHQQHHMSPSNVPKQSCCHCQNQPNPQQISLENVTLSQSCSSNNPPHPRHNNSPETTHHPVNVVLQAHYVNGDGGIPSIEPSSAFKSKPLHHRDNNVSNKHSTPTPNNNQRHHQQQHYEENITNSIQPLSAPPPYPGTTSQFPVHSYNRDSGVVEVGNHPHHHHHNQTNSTNTNSSPSDRPDSQASSSSTTDSEDSGFRSSHCAVQPPTTLNKHGNPLLKPLRRPRNHPKAKISKSGNSTDPQNKRSNTNNNNKLNAIGTPLTTLNPQNLSSQHENHNDSMQTTSLHDISENNPLNNSNRAPPRVLHLNGQNISPNHNSTNNRTILQLSPTKENDWSIIGPAGEGDTKTKRLQHQQQQQQQQQHPQHFDMTDISTHLSWKYLQDISAASSKSDGSNSSADDTHRVVSPLLSHASPPEQPVDVFSYSVV